MNLKNTLFTLFNVMGQPGYKGSLGVNRYMYIYTAESLCHPLETIMTLLISYTPIQNKKVKK